MTQTRPAITLELILDAALELIEQDGLEGLSMRKLGDVFNVQAASLYWYFKSKDVLLDQLADQLYGLVATHIEQRNYGLLNPDEHLRAVLSAYREFLIRHAHLAELLSRSRPVGPGYAALALALVAPTRQLLPTASTTEIGRSINLLLDYVHGAVRAQQAPFEGGRSMVDAVAELDGHLGVPELAEALHSGFADRFQLGLASLIVGLPRVVSVERT